ncbi:double-strand-break repair protein rad21 homolog isoform X2 [Biomphalaria glabrata]|uniref:Double-strand-break repair protein rad21 homolog isoform X2 n=1 Tax=Biomphalaria glabrata TaxID=6526 RepID=A0A2C9K0D7_BIOGL|nr:double-strand-break repair protein rad21 homolog isoform X2 [Biomphalaria glabrata]
MFYASFVLNKKGPLAKIWLAAHWDKKLTKAHVFETNIDSSVEAILKPKVKMALRTSGHLLLGVVRIYSRKAKYLLADCNEAFVKIKMAFRPGVVDLPEENREAAVAAITLQENFHDFETTLADLEDINVQAQFSVNQSRPEEITMREDLGSITLMGDDGFGDVGFDEREILHDDSHLDDNIYKSSEMDAPKENQHQSPADKDKPLDIDLPPPVVGDGFGDGFIEDDDGCDEDNDDNFGDIDQDFFAQNFMGTDTLFEDPPAVSNVNVPQDASEAASGSPKRDEREKKSLGGEADAEETVPLQAAAAGTSAISSTMGEQTTLVHNEEEAFALEPLDITTVPGTERKGKRKRKLIVDEQKGIPSETMKLQLSDTSDIVSALDLAPPTKKLMLWKETGGVEKIAVLPGKPIISKDLIKYITRNLICKAVSDDYDSGSSKIDLDMAPEIARENERNSTLVDASKQMETIIEESFNATEPSVAVEPSINVSDISLIGPPAPKRSKRHEEPADISHRSEPIAPDNQSMFDHIPDISLQPTDIPADASSIVPSFNPLLDDGPPSVAPFSVAPPSVAPPSVAPGMTFDDLEQEQDAEQMPENAEQEEKRWSKRTQQMQQIFEQAFTFADTLSFKDMARNHNRKQAASRFYTLLVLKKHQAICTRQDEPFGDILITKGPHFGVAC